MPKPFQYRSGSLIYFQGDPADKVFILQKGKVSLVYHEIETGEDMRDQVQPGEFFGVKSALGRFPREENAVALTDSIIMALTVHEFEALALENTRLIMKMLKIFSKQMRRLHKRVSSLLAKEEAKPDEELYNLGEYYLKNNRFSHAKHVFSRYLTFYPSGTFAAQAKKSLEAAESSLAKSKVEVNAPAAAPAPVPQAKPATPEAAPRSPGPVPAAPKTVAQSPEPAPAAVRAVDQSPEPAPAVPGFKPDAAKAYYDAVSLISQEKYQQAYLSFKKILDANEDPEWVSRSSYELGRCMFLQNKYEDCIQHYTLMLSQYPRHPDLKNAMLLLGQCYERMGKKNQAAVFYTKIISMSQADAEDGAVIKAKRALKALGG